MANESLPIVDQLVGLDQVQNKLTDLNTEFGPRLLAAILILAVNCCVGY